MSFFEENQALKAVCIYEYAVDKYGEDSGLTGDGIITGIDYNNIYFMPENTFLSQCIT